MTNKSKKVIIKFEKVCDQPGAVIRRLLGFVKAKYLIDLIDTTDLNANPREPRKGLVTDEIRESISANKDIFPFKTKGILLAVSVPPEELERKRFELEFYDLSTEGILDGGHNTLAIALYILNIATDNDREIQKIKTWKDLKNAWSKYKDDIVKVRQSLDLLVPIEILAPVSNNDEVVNVFKQSILEICAARNNNVQLKLETKADAAGHYESIKDTIGDELSKHVIWKTGTEGRIEVRNLIALAWIPLLELDLPDDVTTIKPVQLYSSKAQCVKAFIELMESEGISNKINGKYELTSTNIGSALHLIKDISKLYDIIYEKLPSAYNEAGGKFRAINAVKNDKRKKLTPFYAREVKDNVPDGFIVPLVYGLSALMEVVDGKVQWKIDNVEQFVRDNLPNVLEVYRGIIEMGYHDPQRIGKNSASYNVVKDKFRNCLPR